MARRELEQWRRYRELAAVLARHGLGFIAAELRWPWAVRRRPRGRRLDTLPVHLRQALEEMGPTFVKIGQILSTRADLLPPSYLHELERLQDHVPPVPTPAIRRVIEDELGAPIPRLFAHFEDAPYASASIGQVHRALLPDGTCVVVKVQKPGVDAQVEADLALLGRLARLPGAKQLLGQVADPESVLAEFAQSIRHELDYRREARNLQTMRRNFAGDERVILPRVYPVYSTRRVIVMEQLRGLRIDDLDGIRAAGLDPKVIARRSAHILLASIFEHGLFHADPHPGNFLVTPRGQLVILDCGMMGRVSADTRDHLLRAMAAVARQDPAGVIEGLELLGISIGVSDPWRLRADVRHLLDRVVDTPLREIPLAELVGDVFALARRHHLRVPGELVLLLKTLAMNEGVGRQLDPDFVASTLLLDYLRTWTLRRYLRPRNLRLQLMEVAEELEAAARLPRTLQRLARRLDQQTAGWGQSGAWASASRPHPYLERRLVAAVLATGLAVALAILGAAQGPGLWRDEPLWWKVAASLDGLWILTLTLGRRGGP